MNFSNTFIAGCAAIGGKLESEGPLGSRFDRCETDGYFGKETWEQAESEMSRSAVELLLKKTRTAAESVDVMLGGDLLNQCTATGFAANSLPIPFLGLYGACSTAAESMLIGAAFVSAGYADTAVAVASSHFCSSERQFRFPLEYGSQRPPMSQTTVTGAGAFLIARRGSVRIARAAVGEVTEKGITEPNNMGAAMAPAAADTLLKFLSLSGGSLEDYDAVATGDLGYEGSAMLLELLRAEGICGKDRLCDCGLMIFDREKQDVHAGGSGCGCSACVMAAHFCERMRRKEINRMLFIGTGALLSPKTVLQKQTIPGVAHLIELESV